MKVKLECILKLKYADHSMKDGMEFYEYNQRFLILDFIAEYIQSSTTIEKVFRDSE